MRRVLFTTVALLGVYLLVLPTTNASAAPTITLVQHCAAANGAIPGLNGFPPNTPFHGRLDGPDGSSIEADLATDAGGGFEIGFFSSAVPGIWTFTVEWSGGTLVKTLDVHCPTGRMVGKGSIAGSVGGTASYVYIVRCPLAVSTPNIPFEVRFGTRRFRLTSALSVACFDDPAVPTAAAGFDTQTGFGQGSLTTNGGSPETVFIQWRFVDGGPGGVNDRAEIAIGTDPSAPLFEGSASPPGKFPGSTQTTGFNTAQLAP